jgi:hypothetical protein
MADRYSTKDVKNIFGHFLETFNFKAAKSYNDVGGFALDHNTVYGGYTIVRIINEGGGQTNPFGHSRMKAGEFVRAMNFAM